MKMLMDTEAALLVQILERHLGHFTPDEIAKMNDIVSQWGLKLGSSDGETDEPPTDDPGKDGA